jgi:hypothetical protein
MAQAGVAAPAPASYPYYRLTLLAPLLPAIHTHPVARLGAADKEHRAVALEHVPRVPSPRNWSPCCGSRYLLQSLAGGIFVRDKFDLPAGGFDLRCQRLPLLPGLIQQLAQGPPLSRRLPDTARSPLALPSASRNLSV